MQIAPSTGSNKHYVRKRCLVIVSLLSFLFSPQLLATGIDQIIDESFRPFASALSQIVFYSVPLAGTKVPIVVALLVSCGLFFTLYLGFINLRGFKHAVKIVKGDYDDPNAPG